MNETTSSDSVQPNDVDAPIGFAVKASLVVIAIFVTLILAIGGSYALTISTDNAFKAKQAAAEKALHLRETESSVRTAIPTCKAIIGMDDASHGASNASSDQNSYGHRLARAIHKVNVTSGCPLLIMDLDHHWSILKIAKELPKQEAALAKHEH